MLSPVLQTRKFIISLCGCTGLAARGSRIAAHRSRVTACGSERTVRGTEIWCGAHGLRLALSQLAAFRAARGPQLATSQLAVRGSWLAVRGLLLKAAVHIQINLR